MSCCRFLVSYCLLLLNMRNSVFNMMIYLFKRCLILQNQIWVPFVHTLRHSIHTTSTMIKWFSTKMLCKATTTWSARLFAGGSERLNFDSHLTAGGESCGTLVSLSCGLVKLFLTDDARISEWTWNLVQLLHHHALLRFSYVTALLLSSILTQWTPFFVLRVSWHVCLLLFG